MRPESLATLLIEAIHARMDAEKASRSGEDRLLRGLDGVAVADVLMDAGLRDRGVSGHGLRIRLADALDRGHVSRPPPQDGVVLGALVASVRGVEANGRWAVCVGLELKQRARLLREPGVVWDATTWAREAAAVTDGGGIEDACGGLLERLASELAADLRAAATPDAASSAGTEERE